MKLIAIDRREDKERVLKIIEIPEVPEISYWTSGKGNCVEKSSGKSIADSQCCLAFTGFTSVTQSEFRRRSISCETERFSICYRENKNEIDDDYDCYCEL